MLCEFSGVILEQNTKRAKSFLFPYILYVYDVEHRTSFPRMTLSTAEVTYAIN